MATDLCRPKHCLGRTADRFRTAYYALRRQTAPFPFCGRPAPKLVFGDTVLGSPEPCFANRNSGSGRWGWDSSLAVPQWRDARDCDPANDKRVLESGVGKTHVCPKRPGRRREDSNLRYPCGYNSLARSRFRPLSHASALDASQNRLARAPLFPDSPKSE